MKNVIDRLDRLEKSRPELPHVLLPFSYGERQPEVPAGSTATRLLLYVALRVEADGTEHVRDPRDPDGPVIIRRPGEELPDRTPPDEPVEVGR